MRKALKFSLLTAGLILWLALGVRGYILQVASGTWAPQADLTQARSGASVALLKDGRLLVTGGDGTAGTLASAEIIRTDGASAAAAPMSISRSKHISVLLTDGSVLVAGGTTSGGGATNAAEIYNPVSDSWTTLAGGMIEARSNATATVLQDGRALIAGGEKSGGASSTLEIFDPITQSFSFGGALSSPRTEHGMALLADGRVFIAGGSNSAVALNSTDIYDPVAGSVTAGPVMSTPRSGHSATVMLDGRVLIVGGNNGSADLASVEIFDPVTGTIAAVASSLTTARQGHLAFLLPNNNTVLIVGGTSAGAPLASAEVFTPWLGTFGPTGSLSTAHNLSAGSPMKQDGLLVVASGQDASAVAVANKDLYGFATVKTDAADYPPGSTVTITGSGWQPGETVTLTLVEEPLFDTHGPFTVLADSNGSFSDSSFATDEHDLNIGFVLTATGSVSEAQTIFKDSKPNTVTVGAQTPDPVAPGGSAQYTVTVNFNGNGSSCTSPLSIQNPAVLPAGSTATFSPTSVTSTGGNAASTLTITTTNSTPPTATSISFTVLAANGGGTCQAGTATGTGTLTVVESTTTTLTSSVNPSVFGQSTTLTATVAKTSGPASVNAASVTFKDGATTLGTVNVNASGVATLGVASLTAGSHSLTASYAGTAIFGASNSNTVSQTVNQASTTTTLISGTNPLSSGQSVTFTATVAAVAPGSGTATGTVTFKDGATTIGTGTLAANTATLAISTLTVGSHSITATYDGDSNFTGSTSSALAQTVNQASTTTTISAHTPSPSVVGQAVNITFTVTGGSGTPAGNVTVSDGAAGDSCTATVATGNCSIIFPASGAKTLSAVYAGDTNFTGSTSANVSHTVNAAATTTTITAHTPNPSVIGQAITVNYSVTVNSPGSGTIPGTDNVAVSDGTGDTCTGTVAAGTCQLTPTTSGAKTLTATFAVGDANFATSTSAGVSHTVNKRVTTTGVSLSLTSVVVGQASNATVTITDTDSGTQTNPSGVVTLSSSDTGDTFGTCTLAPSGANAATCTASVTPSKVGTSPHTITATFPADTTHATSIGTANLTVTKASTTTAITSNTPNPSTVGQAIIVDFTATVNSPGAGTLTGNVTVSDGAGDTCSATVAAGNCQITIGTAGAKTLTATYAGDANFLGSASAGTTQTVNPKLAITSNAFATPTGICSSQITAQTQNGDGSAANQGAVRTLNLSSSSANGKFFSDSGCTSQISSAAIGVGSSTVNFFYDDTSIGTPVVTVTSTGLTSATQTEAETGLRFSTGAFTSPLGQCSTAMTLQSANAQAGSPTSLTSAATISLGSSSAGGKFYSDATCTTQITSVVIGPAFDAGHDSPNFFYKDTLAGSPLVTASAGTASATQTETITKITQVFTVPASQTITFGTASITLSGTLAAGTLFPPSGETVSITINSVATSATIGANGAFSATVNTSAIPASVTAYVIAYSYPGDSNFNGATNNATTLTVNKATTATGVVSSLNPSFAGQQVTFTATVTVSAGVPTGTVQFQDGGVNLGSAVTLTNVGGVFSAQLQTSGLAVGAHSITAIYGGDTNFSGSTSSALTQTVKSAVTITSISAPTITYGVDGVVTVTVAAQDSSAGTPTGSVTLSVDGGAALSQSLVNGSAAFTIPNPNAGDHPLSASYAAQNNFNASSATGNLHVNQAVATLAFGTLTFTYDGSPKPVSVTTTPANLGVVTVTYNGSATPPSSAGSTAVSATLTNSNYTAAAINGTEIINQAQASLAFDNLTFTYDGSPKPVTVTTSPAGLTGVTVLYNGGATAPTNAGTTPVSAILTNQNYAATPINGTETIQAAPVVITVSDSMPTYDGNTHQASVSVVPLVSVAITYNGSATLPINAGTYAVSVTTTDPNYAGMATGTLTIKQAQPVVTWSNPADITFGTALSGVQLNAMANIGASSVPGTFLYTPPAGTVLDAGDGQTLTADFTPTDVIDYAAVPGTHATINVKAKALYVISSDGSRAFGQSNPMFTPTFIGLTDGDTPSSVGTVTCQSAAGTTSAPGTYAALCSGVSSTNYSAHYIAGTLSVTNPLNAITEIKGASSNSETLTLGQSDLLTATGKFADASTRALSVAGGSSYARMPLSTPVSGAAIAEAGGVLYAIGGFDGTNTLGTIQAYDPKNDNWTVLPNSVALGTARTNAAVASVAGKIYLIGGTDAAHHALASVEVLDTTGTNPVVTAFSASLSTARNASGAAAFNNKLYVIGGSDNSNSALSSVEIFDLITGAVSTADAGTALAQASGAVVKKNNTSKLYVAGVSGASVVLVNFDGADWSSPVSTSLNAAQGVGATSFGELLYLVNGADVWSYDGTSFTKKNSLPNAHSAAHPVTIGSLIYVASAGSGSTNSYLDAFAPDEVKWTSADDTKATVDQSGNIAAIAITSPTVTITAASLTDPNISADFLLTVIRKTQTIQFDALSPKTYGDADFSVSATSVDSAATATGLLVGFTAGSTDACTVGTSTLAAGVSSATVHITGAGNCTITAAQPGDATTWLPATSVPQTFAIAKANAVIVVTPYSVTYNGDAHTATGTATGVNSESLAGLNLTGTTHTSAGDYPSDAWTFTDVTGNYNNANGTEHDAIAKADAVVVVTPYIVTYDGEPHTATGTAKGVKTETLAGLNLSGTTHTSAGDYPSDPWAFTDVTGNYNNANSTVHDAIAKADAMIVVTPYDVTYDGDPHTATGTAKGVKTETLAGLNLSGTTHTSAGDYPSDPWTFTDVTGNYNYANGTTHDAIAKADPIVAATGGTFTYDGNSHPGSGTATGVKGESLTPVNVAYKDALSTLLTTAPVNAGSYSVAARFAGDGNYNQKQSASVSLVINQANAVISVTPYGVIYDGAAHTAVGSAHGVESPTPVDLTALLHLAGTTHTDAGDYNTDAWTFDGNNNYSAASGTVIDSITKASSVTAVVCPASVTYTGAAQTPCTASVTGAGGLNQPLTVSYANNTNAGTATASATYPGDANHNGSDDTKNFTVAKANATIAVTPYNVIYNGLAHTATGTAKGAMNESLSGLDLSATAHTNARDYAADAWTFTDVTGNYNNANGTVHDAIAKADQAAVTVTGPSDVTYGNTGTATASGGSGTGGYNFSTGSSTGCSVAGVIVSVINASGTCALTATRSGDGNYNDSASSAPFTVMLHKANQATVTVTAPTNVTYGNTGTAAASGGSGTGAYTFNAGASTGCLLSGLTVSVNNASGTCALTAVKAGDNNYNASAVSVPLTVTLNKAAQTITWSTPANIVLGTPLGSTQLNATVTVVGPAPAGTLTYNPAASTVLGVGAHQALNVTAAATNNYNVANATVYINVLYSTGLCLGEAGHQVLQPINADGTSVFKMGSTVPTKFRVCNASGASIGTPGIVIGYGLVAAANSPAITVDEDIYSTTPDTAFRWDSSGQQWIFNQSTKNNPSLKTGVTYFFTINLNDGSSIYFQYGLK